MAGHMDEHTDADDPTGPGPGTAGADAVQAGIEQFQRAALEAIRAGRAMLDAAESVLQDPGAAESVVRSVGSVARTATEAVAGFAAGRWNPPRAEPEEPAGAAGADEDPDPPDGFERITVD